MEIDLLNADGLDDSLLGIQPKPIKLIIKKSAIHGLGLFAGTPIKKGDILMPMIRMNDDELIAKESEPQHYVNHSLSNNSIPFMIGNTIYICASSDIHKGDEILLNYNTIAKIYITHNAFKGYVGKIINGVKKKNRTEGFTYTLPCVNVNNI